MRRSFVALLLVTMLAGCADLSLPGQDRCTLDRATERIRYLDPPDDGRPDDMVQLEPPFVVQLKRSIDFPPQAIVIVEGDGWHHPGDVETPDWPTASVVAPNGELSVVPNAMTDTLTVEHTVDAPGTWTFTVDWDLIGCRESVSVEVLLPDD